MVCKKISDSKADGSRSDEEKITAISQLYQIFPDDVLGSGQFGIVYGGKSTILLLVNYVKKLFM